MQITAEYMKIPQSVLNQHKALVELMDKEPNNSMINVTDAADIIGMGTETLKAAAYDGKCPFAIGGDTGPHKQRFTKIPKLAFWNFMMQGVWEVWSVTAMQELLNEQLTIIEHQNKVIKELTESRRIA